MTPRPRAAGRPGDRPVVTAEDTDRARRVVGDWLLWKAAQPEPPGYLELRGMIAAALAEARADEEAAR